MKNVLGTEPNFASLSANDLLEARDLYHYHLMNKPNVVGTAIGLYFIRNTEPWPKEIKKRPAGNAAVTSAKAKKKVPRTLENSGVREYSWPCVHAFVREWIDESKFGGGSGQLHPEAMVPKTLYLPDGRMVPVCVTKVEQGNPAVEIPNWAWPGGVFGGGMPITVRTQERERVATAGALVTDGHKIYALTSRHVCGDDGEAVYAIARGQRTKIGHGSTRNLARLPFSEVYPEFSCRRTYVNLDVGLIELDDVNSWTSRYVHLGAVGELADLNELNISMRLIDAPVVADGAASGLLEGRIKALFYRFKSVGGYDYVSDFLIAPRDRRGGAQTKPGDSGAVWHLVTHLDEDDEDEFRGEYRPLAIEWGGQVFLGDASSSRYAFGLATSLTTVCQSLNVELVLEHNAGALPYWGQVGHYTIATFACSLIPDTSLKSFMSRNVQTISFQTDDLTAKGIKAGLKAAREGELVIPLADVPDLVWKKYVKEIGGRDTRYLGQGRTTGPEHPTHYADIDEPRSVDGKTLRELCLEDDANISVQFWQQFYDGLGRTKEKERGLLPFRVWQFFDAMVEFAAAKDPDRFFCAAGLLSHYVGDACQPLHGSIYADGYPDGSGGAGVHSTYETKMVDRYASEIVSGVQNRLKSWKSKYVPISSGLAAARETIRLMDRAAKRLPPKEIVDAFIEAGGTQLVAVQDSLWEAFGEATIETMADGAAVLARIWTGAWKLGKGSKISKSNMATWI